MLCQNGVVLRQGDRVTRDRTTDVRECRVETRVDLAGPRGQFWFRRSISRVGGRRGGNSGADGRPRVRGLVAAVAAVAAVTAVAAETAVQ